MTRWRRHAEVSSGGVAQCTGCAQPIACTEDWTLWPWPDGAQLCPSCNDARHDEQGYDDVPEETFTLTRK